MKGFNNIGNTCYLNAGLQLLIQNIELCKLILNYSNKSIILNKISKIILEYYDSSNNNSINPCEIKNIVQDRNNIFNGFNQQDSTEFIIFLLNIIDEEIKKINCNSKEIENIFGINLNVKIKCNFINCIEVSKIKETNFFLFLNITDKCNTLDDCYNEFKSINILNNNNQYFCDKCNTKRDASKRYKIIDWSNYLLINLKRFNQNGMKLIKETKLIEIPMIWKYNMELIGAIIHSGSISSGHYVYIGKKENKWYLFNDNQINEIFDYDIKNKISSAYLLIYKKNNI